jgi:hypothetical protein
MQAEATSAPVPDEVGAEADSASLYSAGMSVRLFGAGLKEMQWYEACCVVVAEWQCAGNWSVDVGGQSGTRVMISSGCVM